MITEQTKPAIKKQRLVETGATKRIADKTLNIRLKARDRQLIDRAAKQRGITVTMFVLEASRKLAEETIIDRSVLVADKTAYASFLEALDTPPVANEQLRRTLSTKAPWDL
ncbi:DUF1778 domain-containing protein [Aeromonas caviae]|uniref:type II toxin-antitoxin system TacA family antitoxin n=1 Tax=Aeromonas caviae TaxID=648 RepID=UPI00308217C5|nr:DUF1778 domain-containing protein [Aeromonas caviae]